jgi:hypothetical protein
VPVRHSCSKFLPVLHSCTLKLKTQSQQLPRWWNSSNCAAENQIFVLRERQQNRAPRGSRVENAGRVAAGGEARG